MYIPESFRVESADKLGGLIRKYSFATLVTHDGQSSFASHLPVLYNSAVDSHGVLVSHMARANPQWKHFSNGQEVLVMFQGPHAYISPSWYQTPLAVPTWNYATVHAYGVPSLITDSQRLLALLDQTISTYEASLPEPWNGSLPEEFRDKMMRAIVGFEIPISRIEGKFKLGQNRSAEDLQGVYKALSGSADFASRALAEMMRTEGHVGPFTVQKD
jgi:transcriptional regulator